MYESIKENRNYYIMLLLICGIGIVCLFHKEYSSLKSLKKVDAYPMYIMDYSADYGLD